jgi:diacylglycerol kinase (ATP)
MKKIILAYNPVSGNASFKYKLDLMVEKFQERDCMLLLYRTQKDNSKTFVDFVQSTSAEGIVIAGGDGTLHEIVNIMLHENIDLPIGILASGTSNDFASFLGVDDDLDRYVEAIAAGTTTPVDVGVVAGEYFINVASAGMLTSVAHEVDSKLKNALGKMAYYLRGLGELPKFRALDLRIEADGEVLEEKAFLFVVVNSGVVGSLKNVAVNAKVDDGKLDLLVVKQCNIPELMSLLAEIISGRSLSNTKNVIYLQAANYVISCDEEVESDLDGERGPKLPLEIQTLPGKMQVFYPKMGMVE